MRYMISRKSLGMDALSHNVHILCPHAEWLFWAGLEPWEWICLDGKRCFVMRLRSYVLEGVQSWDLC